jgi:hypothetical protein
MIMTGVCARHASVARLSVDIQDNHSDLRL